MTRRSGRGTLPSLRIGPDAKIASELEAAADHAAARGATAAAASLAELAAPHAKRTTRGTSSPAQQAAWFHRFAGDFERACAILEKLLAEIPDGIERADVLYAVATTGTVDIPTRIQLCDEALVKAGW